MCKNVQDKLLNIVKQSAMCIFFRQLLSSSSHWCFPSSGFHEGISRCHDTMLISDRPPTCWLNILFCTCLLKHVENSQGFDVHLRKTHFRFFGPSATVLSRGFAVGNLVDNRNTTCRKETCPGFRIWQKEDLFPGPNHFSNFFHHNAIGYAAWAIRQKLRIFGWSNIMATARRGCSTRHPRAAKEARLKIHDKGAMRTFQANKGTKNNH